MNTISTRSSQLDEAINKFMEVDWTFREEKTSSGVHGIHPYPAKFIPQIPRGLIEIFYPISGGAILDPFCGSGTTLVEAHAKHILCTGVDLNPIATLVSRVKLNPPEEPLSPLSYKLASKAKTLNQPIPPIPRLMHWFTESAAQGMANLVSLINEVEVTTTRDALKVTLSRITVKLSRQESDTRYAAIDRDISEDDVYEAFASSARAMDKAFQGAYSSLFQNSTPSEVLTRDILTLSPNDLNAKFGLVITSPPYPNAYEYWLYHKYRMYWLEEDPIAVREREIGARPHYFKKNPATAQDFEDQMKKVFKLIYDSTLPTAFVCILIGGSIIHGKSINNVEILNRAASETGFNNIGLVSREIPSTRKSFNPTNGSIDREMLVVFSKELQ